jgi:hypothetical protein
VCALLTDYDAVRMYNVDFIEELLGVKIEDKADGYLPAEAYEKYFAEGGELSVRHLGKGSRIRDKMTTEERKLIDWERTRG